MFDSDEFISIFLSEANEIVEGLENDLVLLEDNKSDEDLLNKIFRSAHTLKSSAGTVGFTTMSELNHVAENLLEKVRSGKLDVTPKMITVLLEFLDTVKLMLQNIIDGKGEAEGVDNIESLKAKIKAIADLTPFLPPIRHKRMRKTATYRYIGSERSTLYTVCKSSWPIVLEITTTCMPG